MKLLNLITASLMSLSISTSVLADVETPHSAGIQFGGGGLEYKGKGNDGEAVGQSYLYYNYQFSPDNFVEIGLTNGEDVADWECDQNDQGQWNCFSDDDNNFDLLADDIEYASIVIAFKRTLALSERNSLYGKIGAVLYDYEISRNHSDIADESGVGYMAEAGWQYRWDTGIGMNVGLQWQDMGDLELQTFNVGVNYAF